MKLENHNSSFARHAARAALAPNNNVVNVQQSPRTLKHQMTNDSYIDENSTEIDKIVESVTNATKRLSQISTNTNSYERKSKSHVGPWRLGRTLGRGSTGRVRLAKHSETGQLAAVKIVPKSKFKKKNAQDNKNISPYGIEREIIIMKLISHENIMGLYDVWENKGELYLVLEYVEGGELFDYLIKKGRLEEKEAVHYFRQIINGVSYCHQFNICHRDLKPENLLLDKNLNIKIADFGMAALEMNQKLLETSCGSPHYASPEIVTGKTYHGSPSDVWSCGIILFALLTGHLPFDDENIRKLLMKVQSGRFVTPNFLSADAKDLIWRMLKVNPNDRIPIFDILKHPLLRKYETTSVVDFKKLDEVKVENYYHEVDNLKLTKESIDRDLLTSLSILFHGVSESTLLPKLYSPKSNPEKVFYYLLQQYKNKHQTSKSHDLTSKNSKKKVEGLLKKSKSTIHTTIVDIDGTTLVTVDTVKEPKSNPKTPIKKTLSKSGTSQILISASSSSRRGVSLNNKQISTTIPNISRSSSKLKISTTNNIEKKRHSILPPLPDLDFDWLKLDPSGVRYDEFSALYEEIFNKSHLTPKQSRSRKRIDQESTKKDGSIGFVSSPMPFKKREHRDRTLNSKQDANDDRDGALLERKTSDRRILSEPPQHRAMERSSTLKVSNLIDFKTYETPRSLKPLTKKPTLDPKYKRRTITPGNADVLTKVGLKLDNTRTQSKIFYSKSSTSLNLSDILNKATSRVLIHDDMCSVRENEPLNSQVQATNELTHEPRVSSSNYPSFEDGSVFNSSNEEASFDFEVPTETEIAQAIQVSNGSDLTVGRSVAAREDSMFEDMALNNENTMRPSNSDKSVIQHHKRAASSGTRTITPTGDIRGSLYNNPNESREGGELPYLINAHKGYQRPRCIEVQNDIEDSKSTILNESLYVDNTDDEVDMLNAKRVTMIFDDFSSSPIKRPLTSVNRSPIRSSPLKSIQERNFLRNSDGTFVRSASKSVAMAAPIIPNKGNETVSVLSGNAEKSNWFTRFFSNLVHSESKNIAGKKRNTKVFTSKRPISRTKKSIRNVLEIKRKEGTLNSLQESGNVVSATIPATFALGKPLRFEIHYCEDDNKIRLTKLKGSKKTFKKLISAMEYVVDNGSF